VCGCVGDRVRSTLGRGMLGMGAAPIVINGTGPEAQQQAGQIYMQMQMQHLANREAELREKETKQREQEQAQAVPPGMRWAQERRPGAQPSGGRACYNCGDPEHFANACPLPPRPGSRPRQAAQSKEMEELRKTTEEQNQKIEQLLNIVGANGTNSASPRATTTTTTVQPPVTSDMNALMDAKLSEMSRGLLAEVKEAIINHGYDAVDQEDITKLEGRVEAMNSGISATQTRMNTLIRKLAGKIDWQTEHLEETNTATATNVRTSMDLMKQHLEAQLRKNFNEVKKVAADVADIRGLMARREQMNIDLRAQVTKMGKDLDVMKRANPVPVVRPSQEPQGEMERAEAALGDVATPRASVGGRSERSWASRVSQPSTRDEAEVAGAEELIAEMAEEEEEAPPVEEEVEEEEEVALPQRAAGQRRARSAVVRTPTQRRKRAATEPSA
jgi:hypothetical protein